MSPRAQRNQVGDENRRSARGGSETDTSKKQAKPEESSTVPSEARVNKEQQQVIDDGLSYFPETTNVPASSMTSISAEIDKEEIESLRSELIKVKLEKSELERSMKRRIEELEIENVELRMKAKQSTESGKGRTDESSDDVRYKLEDLTVIIDLQEELSSLRQLHELSISQNKVQTNKEEEDSSVADSTLAADTDPDADDKQSIDWRAKYQQLHVQYSRLENDRAFGEYQLRNRITEDSLKYHRRLIHWKTRTHEIEKSLQDTRAQYTEEISRMKVQLQTSAASVLQHSLRDLRESQNRVKKLEEELCDSRQQANDQKQGELVRSHEENGKPKRLSILDYYKDKNMI